MPEKRQLVIIGGGLGGYAAALRAAQLRIRATLVEEDRIGGTCMNTGCIPTKFLLRETGFLMELRGKKRISGAEGVHLDWKSVQENKRNIVERLVRGMEFLLERNRVEVLKGKAEIRGNREVRVSNGGNENVLAAEKIILAMGSRSADLPFLKPNGKEVITHREALELESVPRSLIVVGAGAIGLEIGTIFARMGTEVTVLEIMPAILPGMDRQIASRLDRLLKKQGLKIFTDMRIENSRIELEGVQIKGTCLKTQTAFSFQAEKLLLAAGRKANSEILIQDFKEVLGKNGYVQVSSRLETRLPGIYGIGDLIGGKLLAHKAEHEGIIAAENAAGEGGEMDYRALPMAVFTEPEFASVGLTEEEAGEKRMQIQVGVSSLQASGRAATLEKPDGMVKIIATSDDRLVGAHLLAPNASEIVAELALAIEKGLTLRDLFSTMHVHPTLSEAVMEAARKAKGMAIHALNE